jgi:hypothetical protein
MARTSKGTITSVATALATAKNITGISNAASAVCTCVAHGYSTNDIVLVYSSWGRLNYRAFKVQNLTADTFALVDADTTNTSFYTPGVGAGAGTVQKVTTWVDLDRTMNHSSSGGEPKTVTQEFIESDVPIIINDGATPITRTFEMDADQIGTPGYNAMKTLSANQTPTVIRRSARTGAFMLIPGTVWFNEEEREADGQIVKVSGSINGQNVSTRYAS